MKTPQKSAIVNRVMGIKEWVLIIILSIIWGGSFFFAGVAVKELPPLATAGPTNLLLVTFLIPVSAIALGVMFLGEILEWDVFFGMGMIFIGLITIDGRLLIKFRRP